MALVAYVSSDERVEKVIKNKSVLRQPIVRNGRRATIGYAPDDIDEWLMSLDQKDRRIARMTAYNKALVGKMN